MGAPSLKRARFTSRIRGDVWGTGSQDQSQRPNTASDLKNKRLQYKYIYLIHKIVIINTKNTSFLFIVIEEWYRL